MPQNENQQNNTAFLFKSITKIRSNYAINPPDSHSIQFDFDSAYLDSEVGRENPGERVVLGGPLPGGALGGLEEDGAQLEGAIDELGLIGIGGPGLEEALEGEVDGEGRRVGELEKCVEEAVTIELVEVWGSRVLGGAGSLRHG